MPRYRWGRRRGGPGRPFSNLILSQIPHVKEFKPNPVGNPQPIELIYPEYDVIRLVDLEELTQEQAAKRMKTSRGTVWRLLQSARKKVAQTLTESRPLLIAPKGKIEKIRKT